MVIKQKEIGIYIHIPFCARKCFYCDFVSYANKEEKISDYINAITYEIESFAKEFSNDYIVTTIYIGGGTPSSIESTYIVSIIKELNKNYNIQSNAEITIEVNPGTVTRKKLQDYKKAGINRLSIGLQSTNDYLLKEIGRIHTYEQFLDVYSMAREVGFSNINVDLMIALPNQTMEILEDSLNKVVLLNPEHISVYSLILEEGTKLDDLISKGKLELVDEELERKMYWKVKNMLQENGYKHYEISNFAKKGYESKHNLNCWEQKEYVGFGVSAHSYYNKTRYSNTESIDQYIKKQTDKTIHEIQKPEDEQKEYMMLGLRKIDGICISSFKNKFSKNPIYMFRKELEKLVKEELLEIDLNYIKLTNKGIDLANLVWQEFI